MFIKTGHLHLTCLPNCRSSYGSGFPIQESRIQTPEWFEGQFILSSFRSRWNENQELLVTDGLKVNCLLVVAL